jgi:hypothetical protein
MRSWEQRPSEVARLINPAFCSILMRDAIGEYSRARSEGMPYSLCCFVLPIVLHKSTREALPGTTRTTLHMWLERRPDVRIGFPDRMRSLIPHTREALIFAISRGKLTLDGLANVVAAPGRIYNPGWPELSEPAICRRKARFLGKWLGRAGDPSTIYTMWGVRP